MTFLRAAPGPQISQGRIRVDAARAIAKLREYQLVDRTTWVLEAIRAAVASKASALHLAADANDVWLAWEGPVWPAEMLPRLFDELVSPEPEQDHHHYRLLATAINSALGLAPAFVDVVAIGDGAPMRVRYTPDVLDVPPSTSGDLDDSPLRRLAAVAVTREPDWPAIETGMVVHYRRRAGLDVLKLFVGLATAPELVHAAKACGALPVPLHLGTETVWREARDREVVRVPLGEPIDGHLAIVDPRTLPRDHEGPPIAEIAERGVVLARYPLDLGIAATAHPAPVRMLVDAPRLPTNASRSEVRRDAHPIPLAEERAKLQLPALYQALRDACAVECLSRAAREAALALIAAAHPDHTWLAGLAGSTLGGLLDLPLVRDACGVPRPVARTWKPFVHTGRSPMPAELAPWLSDVLWADEDIVRRLVSVPIERGDFKNHVRWARRQLRAKDWFYGHQPRSLRVDTTAPPRVRARIGAPFPGSSLDDTRFEGVTGELCLLSTGGWGGEAVILLERRELDRMRFTGTLEIAAVVEDPRITPGDRYRRAQQDEAYRRLEGLIRDSALRAAEAIALNLAGERVPDGYEVAAVDAAHDLPIVMDALEMASQVPEVGPLVDAPLWQTRDGRRSLRDLRAESVIALAGVHTYVPPGRLVVETTNRTLLERLLPTALLVTYGEPATSRTSERDLATMLLAEGCEHALGIVHGTLRGAIAPYAGESAIFHAGVPLKRWRYARAFTIFLECDEVVPSRSWDDLADDLQLPTRDFNDWEVRLARAVARALVGDRDPLLLGGALGMDSGSAHWLFDLYYRVGATLLEPALAAKLRAHPLLPLLGDPQLRSIDELEALFPNALVFVETGHTPEAGFTPLVASPTLARALGELIGRQCVDGVPELQRLALQRLREERIAKHRARPAAKVALPYETPRIQQTTQRSRGQIGVAHEGFELHVFVDERPFETVRKAAELPVVAALEVSPDLADEAFEALTPAAHDALLEDIHAAIPALLARIAESSPALFGQVGRAQQLLHDSLARLDLPQDVREALRAARGFPAVQGKLASVDEATRGDTLLVGSWSQEWLGPDGAPVDLDAPILRIDSEDTRAIVQALHHDVVRDCSDDLARLQAQRQMARGLLPIPTIPGAAAEVRRTFAELGETDGDLGFGEIALADAEVSHALIHVHGKLRERVEIQVQPPVDIAIEAPEASERSDDVLTLLELRGHPIERGGRLQRVANKLVQVLAKHELPPRYARRIRRAMLSGRLDPGRLADLPIFDTTDGSRADWTTFEQQRALFDHVWVVAEPTTQRPLDERRRVFVLPKEDFDAALAARRPVIDARRELALDETARKNRARPKATALALPGAVRPLVSLPLPGDGTSGPRGIVAVLSPQAAQQRIAHVHRDMHPFDPVADPCAWPTVTVLDDARLVPDRVWQMPEGGPIWSDVVEKVRAASERALVDAVTIPAIALASERITALSHSGLPSLASNPKVRIRGALWLDGEPRSSEPPPPIYVEGNHGSRAYSLERAQGLTGRLFVHAPDGFHEDTLGELCAAVYGRLVRELVKQRLFEDLTLAHLAHAVAMGRVDPVEVRHGRLTCFRPAALEPAAWASLLASHTRVPVLRAGDQATELALFDDGSALARVVKGWLDAGTRFVREPAVVPSRPVAPRTASPVEELVQRVVNRLVGLEVPRPVWHVSDRAEPLVAHDQGLEFAGQHPQLRAIAAAMLAGSPWVDDAIDALAAHALTVMNVALAEVTDATEIHALGGLLGARQ